MTALTIHAAPMPALRAPRPLHLVRSRCAPVTRQAVRPRPQPVRPVVTAAACRQRSTLRVTRRGRLVMFVGASAVSVTALVAGAQAAWAVVASEAPPQQTITVLPGDTLWDVAAATGSSEDPRDTMVQIMRDNDLSSQGLQAGQQLIVPLAD